MSGLARFREGMNSFRSGDFPAVIDAMSDLLARQDLPGRLGRYYSAMAHRALALEHLRSGNYHDAAGRLQSAIALVGRQADLAGFLCAIYSRMGQDEQALGQAQHLSSARPEDAKSQLLLAQMQRRAGQGPLAMLTLSQALRRTKDACQLHVALGLLYCEEGQYELARQHLLQAAQCRAGDARLLRYLALVEAAAEQYAAAAGHFQRACSSAPNDLLLLYELSLTAAAAAQAGQPLTINLPQERLLPEQSQLRQLARHAASEPDFVEAFLSLPASAADEELFGLLATVLEAALQEHPLYADLHYQVSRVRERLGDPASAKAHAQQAVQINPSYRRALVHLAHLEHLAGRTQEAMAWLKRALSAGADWADVHAQLGDLLSAAGQADGAAEHYQRALQLNPDYPSVRAGLERLAA